MFLLSSVFFALFLASLPFFSVAICLVLFLNVATMSANVQYLSFLNTEKVHTCVYLCVCLSVTRERKCVIDNAYLSVFGIVPFRFSFGSLPLWNSGTAKGLKCAHSATFTCRQACTDTYIVISHYHSGNLWASIPMHLHVCVHARGLHILSVQLVTDRWFCSVSVLHDFSLQRTLSGLVLFLSHHASQPVVISL